MVTCQVLPPTRSAGMKFVDRFALKGGLEVIDTGNNGAETAELAFVFAAENFWKGPSDHVFY